MLLHYFKEKTQAEKSVYCQSLQPARCRSGCNPWVMPVLPISTVPSVGTPLGRHWLNTGAVLLFSAGKPPTFVYCQASVQHWISTGAVPTFNVSKQPTFEYCQAFLSPFIADKHVSNAMSSTLKKINYILHIRLCARIGVMVSKISLIEKHFYWSKPKFIAWIN